MTFEKVLDEIPKKIVAGNSISWRQSLTEFPATAWTLYYYLINASGLITITAAADGTDHLVEIAPATSAAYSDGDYEFQKVIKKSDNSERYMIGSGSITIAPDYSENAAGLDARSFVKRTLDYLEALIEGKVQKDRANYAVNGRQLSTYSWEEIYKIYEDFKAQYAAELRKKRGRSSTVRVVFS